VSSMRMSIPIFFASMAFGFHALAAAPIPAVQAEIETLMNALESSGCDFNRNGSWYTAADAKKHLLQKLAYLNDKITLKSAEQFIEVGGSKSSMSGKPYLVRCPGATPIESQKWLLLRLNEIRGSATPLPSNPK